MIYTFASAPDSNAIAFSSREAFEANFEGWIMADSGKLEAERRAGMRAVLDAAEENPCFPQPWDNDERVIAFGIEDAVIDAAKQPVVAAKRDPNEIAIPVLVMAKAVAKAREFGDVRLALDEVAKVMADHLPDTFDRDLFMVATGAGT